MTKHISMVEARSRFSEVVGKAAKAGEHFIIERMGKPVAAVIGMDDYELLLQTLERKTNGEEAICRRLALEAWGMWADRDDIGSPVQYVEKLRGEWDSRNDDRK